MIIRYVPAVDQPHFMSWYHENTTVGISGVLVHYILIVSSGNICLREAALVWQPGGTRIT